MGIHAAMIVSCLLAAGTEIRGNIRDQDGRPATGASVSVTSWATDGQPLLAEGTVDAEGRYRISLPDAWASASKTAVPSLWVYRPGSRLAHRSLRNIRRMEGELPSVSLGAPAQAQFVVQGPDRKPVAGARVRPSRLDRSDSDLPESMSRRLERTTDPLGRVTLDGLAPQDVRNLAVEAKGLGSQTHGLKVSTGERTIRLQAVGSVSGRIVAPGMGAAPRKGWRIWVSISSEKAVETGPAWHCQTDVITDEEGRFRVPEIAAGPLRFSAYLKDGADFCARPVLDKVVEAGRETILEVPLVPAVRVSGRFLERETDKPVVGLRFTVMPQEGIGSTAVTDAAGRFSALVAPGNGRFWIPNVPRRYYTWPGWTSTAYLAPEGGGEVDTGTFRVPLAASPLRGVLRDERKQPIHGVRITGQWTVVENGESQWGQAIDWTDSEGRFVLEGVPPSVNVSVSAFRDDLTEVGPVTVLSDSTSPMTIEVAKEHRVAIRGRALDREGRPVPGLLVRINAQKQIALNSWTDAFMDFQGSQDVLTGPDGRFETPRVLPAKHEYQVELRGEGYVTAKSNWLAAANREVIEIPDLVSLRMPATDAVSGRVVDRAGRPVEGAEVFQQGDGPARTQTRTDSRGIFRIEGFARNRGFLFVRKEGYRFRGMPVSPGKEGVEIVVSRSSEPPEPLATRTWPVNRDEERALARALAEPPGQLTSIKRGDEAEVKLARQALAWGDPERALRMLVEHAIPESATFLPEVACGQLESNTAEAMRLIASVPDPAARAAGYLTLARACTGHLRTTRPEMVKRALIAARRIESPDGQVVALGEIADEWLLMGEMEKARNVVRLTRTMRPAHDKGDDFAGGLAMAFAPQLAIVDLPAALAILKDAGREVVVFPWSPAPTYGEIAWRIAAVNSAEAERLLRLALADKGNFKPELRPEALFRICRGMATADLVRARGLLSVAEGHIQPFYQVFIKAMTLGQMAARIVDSKPDDAKQLLDDMYGQLERACEAGTRVSRTQTACVMAAYLPLVEKVDPDHLSERFWLSVSFRDPMLEDDRVWASLSEANLAAALARFDMEVARAVAAPVEDAILVFASEPDRSFPPPLPALVGSLACVDPMRAAALVRRIPADRDEPAPRQFRSEGSEVPMIRITTQSRCRLALARMLGFSIDRRRREACDDPSWPPSVGLIVDPD